MFFKNGLFIILFCGWWMVSCGPSDGAFVDHYPNGKIKEEGFYKDGKKTGLWQFYWKDGAKKVTGAYVKDEPHGQWIFYDESGKVIGTGTYKNGQMWDGRFVRYVLGTKKIIVVREGQQTN